MLEKLFTFKKEVFKDSRNPLAENYLLAFTVNAGLAIKDIITVVKIYQKTSAIFVGELPNITLPKPANAFGDTLTMGYIKNWLCLVSAMITLLILLVKVV